MDKLIEKLVRFQKTTGVEDIDVCVETLDRYCWDFDIAVSSLLSCKSTEKEGSIDGEESIDLIKKEASNSKGFKLVEILAMFLNAINRVFSINSKSDTEAEAAAAAKVKFSEAVKFVVDFERENGSNGLKFLPRSLEDANRSSLIEKKLIFLYLHSPLSPHTSSFCKNTLCCEILATFLNENFIVWGANIDSIEGKYLRKFLPVSRFPFCAVVLPGLVIHYEVDRAISAKDLLTLMLKLFEARSPQAGYDPKRNEKEDAYVAALRADKAPKTTETLERVRREVAAYERENS